MIMKLGMGHQGLEAYEDYINDDPDLTLNFLQQGQIWSKLLSVLIPDK